VARLQYDCVLAEGFLEVYLSG